MKEDKRQVYLDNAATSYKKPATVIEAVVDAMQHSGNAGRGVHHASLLASRGIYQAREKLAKLLEAEDASCVAFTQNSTEALNIAIKGTLEPGDHVITTVMEHNSVLRPLYELQRQGTELTIVGCDELGNLNYTEMERAVRKNTKAIVCTHGSNLTGNQTDPGRIQKIKENYGLLWISDASQTAGACPIHMSSWGIDILCFTGHKSLLGPQGTGGLCVRKGLKVRPLKTGGSGFSSFSETHPEKMPEALEAGTLNSHGIAGLSAAAEFLLETGVERIQKQELALMWQFYDGICSVPGIRIYGDFSDARRFSENRGKGPDPFAVLRCPIVSLNIKDRDSSEISDLLFEDYGISTRPGAHCAPLMHRALGTEKQGAVRFSFSCFNTEEEVDLAVHAVRELAEEV